MNCSALIVTLSNYNSNQEQQQLKLGLDLANGFKKRRLKVFSS